MSQVFYSKLAVIDSPTKGILSALNENSVTNDRNTPSPSIRIYIENTMKMFLCCAVKRKSEGICA